MPERNESEIPAPEPVEPLPLNAESGEPKGRTGQTVDPVQSHGKGERRRHTQRADDRRQRLRQPGRHRTLWIFLLSAMLVAETVAFIVLFSLLGMREKERWERKLAIEEGARELAALRSESATQEEDMGRLVRARLPRLRPVRMDSVIPIGEAPVSNIVFTTSGNNRSVSCEYKVLLSNPGPSPIQVRLDVLFFSRAGIQIGRSPIGGGRDGASALLTLEPSEARSYSGTAGLDPKDGLPVYFMLAGRGGY